MADTEDTRWLSYAELADIRGTDVDSAVRLVRRRGWPKRKANDGTIRVAVPGDMTRDIKPRLPEHTGDITPDITREYTGDSLPDTTSDIELYERAARAESQVVELRQSLARAIDQADAATRLAESRLETVHIVREHLTEALVNAARAEGEAAALRDTLAEARRPAWRRWIGLP